VQTIDVSPAALVSDLTVVVFVAGIVGARLFHILENSEQFAADPWSMIASRTGLSVFGGMIVGALAGLVMLRRWKLPLSPFFGMAQARAPWHDRAMMTALRPLR
jgi:phosphatidylglycerol:prolipoprotein diacylglycerol transferase